MIEFLQNSIATLNEQMEVLECELENLGAAPGGRGGRKKGVNDRSKARKEEEVNHRLDRHKYHIHHLELIMRLLNNETLETQQVPNSAGLLLQLREGRRGGRFEVKDIKEDIEDYIIRNSEDNFEENEYIYEDLNMGDLGSDPAGPRPLPCPQPRPIGNSDCSPATGECDEHRDVRGAGAGLGPQLRLPLPQP